ncbi:glycine--tRNA ligase subunit beta [Taylorella equigenitalis]|uniref:glycine--tRNA ligase subunit beta n=1 Tax=Taylorella equigenitalis TaxID=29575 RepID=UPI00237D9346|nr:glycine--tRNA ligase subunit beta [Taylorella equigenitalis]WDU51591.1 glycine--tRNA ligase subunit beta [Taylorella equigenitalis]
MSNQSLLIELFTEELPPKALRNLSEVFASEIVKGLVKINLLEGDSESHEKYTVFATPRRLAVLVRDVLDVGPEQPFTEKLMPKKVGLDSEGNATAALTKKLESKGMGNFAVSDLQVKSDGKQDYLYLSGINAGRSLKADLQAIFQHAVDSLPIPKVMRYQLADGKTSVKFVRPVHGLVAMHGSEVIDISAFGINSSNVTHGHRFMGKYSFEVSSADSYEKQLLDEGMVVASYSERMNYISSKLESISSELGLNLGSGDEVNNLIEEVTSLVEYPEIYVGEFEEKFLQVPSECLILTMRLNQKYFPLFNPDGSLSNKFLIVSNMKVSNPSNIIEGNQRVVRPRLADAEFFYETDKKLSFEQMLEPLKTVVYHNKIGSQFERVERIEKIAKFIASKLGADESLASRAALLSKADLSSNMVGEFPELQGIMGSYYSKLQGEPEEIYDAIKDQYKLKFDREYSNKSVTSLALYLADRIETLIGIWGIGSAPTGERDPYGLRRAALGLISAIESLSGSENENSLNLSEILHFAQTLFSDIPKSTAIEVEVFIYDKLKNQLYNTYSKQLVDSVLTNKTHINDVVPRIKALSDFSKTSEASSLATANKRISNILKKIDYQLPAIDKTLFKAEAEKNLYESYVQIKDELKSKFTSKNYNEVFLKLSTLRDSVDKFFEDVMVMDEDIAIRNNRLALLKELHEHMNLVADISLLAN